ncbi:kynureninase [Pseudonocardiaceae bacterium YIM PH 21723]|nr:kynureninase [Pseudonocardiaceae bacterium YIM PH 21723]
MGRAEPAVNDIARQYSRFRVTERILLTGHSHQAWPDVALDGQLEAFEDAALAVDDKWGRAFAKADSLRDTYRMWLQDPEADIALGANTHDLVLRFLSALDLRDRPKLISTDGEFHTLRRQLDRLAEEGVQVVRVPADDPETLAGRLASQVDDRTSAVLVSAVLFETSRIVPGLAGLADACARVGAELLVDAYHALGPVPVELWGTGLENAWIVGGGYKYLQFGEGNCFLRLPAHAQQARPVITGWFSEFSALTDAREPGKVAYGTGGDRFAGATYDTTSHYRAVRVAEFFAAWQLTPKNLRSLYQQQLRRLSTLFDDLDLPASVIDRDRSMPVEAYGGFLSLHSPRAGELQRALAEHGVHTDSRGSRLRFGPAPYLTDDQLAAGMAELRRACR